MWRTELFVQVEPSTSSPKCQVCLWTWCNMVELDLYQRWDITDLPHIWQNWNAANELVSVWEALFPSRPAVKQTRVAVLMMAVCCVYVWDCGHLFLSTEHWSRLFLYLQPQWPHVESTHLFACSTSLKPLGPPPTFPLDLPRDNYPYPAVPSTPFLNGCGWDGGQGNHWAMNICTHSLHQCEITNREINEQCPNEGSTLVPNGPVSFYLFS